jgi:hypothetical protein
MKLPNAFTTTVSGSEGFIKKAQFQELTAMGDPENSGRF